MKRMSEVFELPLSYVDVAEFTVNLTVDEVFHVRAAINHVDALADALAACADILGEMEATENVSDTERAYCRAIEALAAYRGDK